MELSNPKTQEIIELAKKGLTTKTIANQVYINETSVGTIINRLNNPEDSIYDPETYNTIIFMKEMHKIKPKIVDKDLLKHIIVLLKKGFTFYEIAIFLQMLEQEIKSCFAVLNDEKNPFYDELQYNELKSLEKKNQQREPLKAFKRLEVLENIRGGGV